MNGELVQTAGYQAVGDGGGNLFRYNSTDTTPGDGGWIVEYTQAMGRFHAVDKTYADIRKFGATSDDGSDDRQAIQNAIDAVQSKSIMINNLGGSSIYRRVTPRVYFPQGVYHLKGTAQDASVGLVVDSNEEVLRIKADDALLRPHAEANEDLRAIDMQRVHHGEIDGLVFDGFRYALRIGATPDNVNLGEFSLRRCDFIGGVFDDIQDAEVDIQSVGLEIFNRSASVNIDECQFDNYGLHFIRQISCDMVKITNSRFQVAHFLKPPERPQFQGYLKIEAGQMLIRDCIFNPPDTAYPEDLTNPGEYPIAWFLLQDYPQETPTPGETSRWCELDVSGSLFGAEGAGMTTVIYNTPPSTSGLRFPFGVRLVNNELASGRVKVGKDDADVETACHVLLLEQPNKLVVKDNHYSTTRSVAAAYSRVHPAPARPPLSNAANEVKLWHVNVRDNYGSESAFYGRNANWIPGNIAHEKLLDQSSEPNVEDFDGDLVLADYTQDTDITNFRGGYGGMRFGVKLVANATIKPSANIATIGNNEFSIGTVWFVFDQDAKIWRQVWE